MSEDNELTQKLIVCLSYAIHTAYDGYSVVKCPHCGVEKDLPILALSPIVICACSNCNQYVLPFAGQLLPLSKNVIESGCEEDRRFVIIEAIMMFLHKCVRGLVAYRITDPTELIEGGIESIPDNIEDLEKLWGEGQDEEESE